MLSSLPAHEHIPPKKDESIRVKTLCIYLIILAVPGYFIHVLPFQGEVD